MNGGSVTRNAALSDRHRRAVRERVNQLAAGRGAARPDILEKSIEASESVAARGAAWSL